MFSCSLQQRLQSSIQYKAQKQFKAQSVPLKTRRNLFIVNSTQVAPDISVVVKDFAGKETAQIPLSLKIQEDKLARGQIHRAVVYERRLKRRGTACTLTRAEVRGGGRKPYQQKGTGNARRGSSRSPLIKGGGVIFGPRPRDWSIDINNKELNLAISTALQDAARHNDLTIIEDFGEEAFKERKTRNMQDTLMRLGISFKKKNDLDKVLIVLHKPNKNYEVSGRNVSNLNTLQADNLNTYDILNADKIFIEQSALAIINDKYGAKKQ